MGIQRTKKYLRACVWFPGLDAMVERAVQGCIPCQATTPGRSKEPLVMTELPPEPWQLVAADIFGPLPTGQKILVLKCLRSKWPEIKIFLRTQRTDASSVIQAMEKMFAVHGVPDTVRTDNGPPFNSKSFKEYSRRAGFQTQRVTPLWPQANGQAEAFMKCLGKVIRTAIIEKKDWSRELDRFLMAYRATPHPSTGQSPAALMYPNRRFKTLLPSGQHPSHDNAKNDASVKAHNDRAMQKAKTYADIKSHAKPHSFSIGDRVLVKQQKKNKFSSYFDPNPFMITDIKGSMITAVRNNHPITRNSSFFRKLPPLNQPCKLTTAAKAVTPAIPRFSAVLPTPLVFSPAAAPVLDVEATAPNPNHVPDSLPGTNQDFVPDPVADPVPVQNHDFGGQGPDDTNLDAPAAKSHGAPSTILTEGESQLSNSGNNMFRPDENAFPNKNFTLPNSIRYYCKPTGKGDETTESRYPKRH